MRKNRARESRPEKRGLNRRSYLQKTGAALASMAVLSSASSPVSAADYQTITVPAGESKQVQIGSGETFEDTLVDVTARGAEFRIIASGNDWLIRNVGWMGPVDTEGGVNNRISAEGNGTIEGCYIANGESEELAQDKSGSTAGSANGGIGVPAHHSGQIDVIRCHIAGWSGNAIYAGGAGRAGEGGGTVHVDQCYFHDNNISHVRVASDGCTVKNTVIHNTNNVPVGHAGIVNSRGIYDGYGSRDHVISIENCDIKITSENTNGGNSAAVASETTFQMKNCRVEGQLHGAVERTSQDSNPDISIPTGVPKTAKGAVTGTDDTGGGSDSPTTTPSDGDATGTLLELVGNQGVMAEYQFTVEGTASKATSDVQHPADTNDADAVKDNGDGTVTVSGIAGNGSGDSYHVDGVITSMQLDESKWTLTYGGSQVSPSDITFPKKLVIDGSDSPDTVSNYRFTLDGSARKSPSLGSVNDYDEISSGEITGRVMGGKDGYRFSGKVTGFNVDSDAVVRIEDGS